MSPLHVVRSLGRARGLALAAVGMLGLGVGALTTTFGLIDAALIRQPPFTDASRIALLYLVRTTPAGIEGRARWSYPRKQLLAREVTSFAQVANYSPATVTLTGTGDPETLAAEVVSPPYFSILQVRPVKGRAFLPDEDDAPGAHPVTLLSHQLWTRRFAADSGVIGRTVGLNGVQLTVVGILPPGFRGLSDKAQLWIPTTMAPSLTYDAYLTTNQNFISVVGRLRPGATIATANAELAVLGAQINRTIPSSQNDRGDSHSATALPINAARVDDTTRRSMLVLLAAVALLHLLASANVANLLLVRAAARRREAAVRAALGCGSARLVRFFLAEGIVLAASGGAAGLLLAWWASRVIVVPNGVWGPNNFYGSLGAFDAPVFGLRVALFGVLLTFVTMVLVTSAPAVSMWRTNTLSGLRSGSRSVAPGAGTLRRPTIRGVIVALEAALAVLLLVSGGLMMTSFQRMRSTELGVDADNVLTFLLRPSDVQVPPAAAPHFLDRILGAITSVPGVVSATVDGGSPVNGSARSSLHIVGAPEAPAGQAPPIIRHYVAPTHFRTLGVPLLKGRAFTSTDRAGAPKVTVISKSAAERFWPGRDPIGQRVWFDGNTAFGSADSSAEIVGIVRDVVNNPLDQQQNPHEFYTPYAQFTYSWRVFFVRTTSDPLNAVGAVRKAVLSQEPDLPLTEVMTLRERIGDSWARQRFDAILFGTFAVVALLLASAGIYAVVAYAVSQRTREMGIRLALGAQPSAIVGLVVREGMALPLVGLLVGVGAAAVCTRLLRASLYEVTPSDPKVFLVTIALLAAVSVVACLVPAWRATLADPVEALRAE